MTALLIAEHDNKSLKDATAKALTAAAALGVDVTPRLVVLKVEEPQKREAGVKVGSVAELVDKLKTEARVI